MKLYKLLLGWVMLLCLFAVFCYVVFIYMERNFGNDARLEKLKKQNYKYEVTCTVNGKQSTKVFLVCNFLNGGLSCGNTLSNHPYYCKGNYNYNKIPR